MFRRFLESNMNEPTPAGQHHEIAGAYDDQLGCVGDESMQREASCFKTIYLIFVNRE